MSKTDNEKKIWDLLMKEIKNPYGVAGLMGNLMAESSLNPFCKTGGKADIKKMPGQEYVDKVMCGHISSENFAHDGVAFGLAQWCYYSRKEALYKCIRENGLGLGSIEGQVGYILKELPKYKTVWKTLQNAVSVGEASDIVLLRYEKPANVSDKVKAKRALYAEGYYERHAAGNSGIMKIPQMIDVLEDILEHEMLHIERHDRLMTVIADLSEMAKGE